MTKRYPLLRCLAMYRHMPWRFTTTALLFVAVNLSLAWQQGLIGRAVNDVQQGTAVVLRADGSLDYTGAWTWLAILLGVAALRGVCQYLAGLMSLIIGQDLLTLLRERILVQVQRLDLAWHWEHGLGEVVTRTTRDADKLRDALVSFWRQVVETSLVALVAVGLLCSYSMWLGLFPLAMMLVSIAIFLRQTDTLVRLDRAVGDAYDKVTQDLSEGVHGVRVIKAFGLEQGRIANFSLQVGDYVAHARAALGFSSSRIFLPQFVVALGHVWVVAFGVYLVTRGDLNVGQLVAAILMVNTMVFRIEGVGRVMQVFADARSSAARIWEILDARPSVADGGRDLPDGALGIRLDAVHLLSPGGGNSILRDCSLTIEPGEIVALVGATGSGKSSLLGLLPRLLDVDGGHVSIGSDHMGWHDVATLNLDDLRRRVHIVPQESFLFSDTLAANLRGVKPSATEAQMRHVMDLAAAGDVLARLPDGFDSALGDRGVTLSGGQRQRLCLARALLADASVLGLDDATSALDATTERTVLNNIRALQREVDGPPVTVLIVSSKLPTILLADRVLVLAEGRIVAQGTHAVLSLHNPAYRELMGMDEPAGQAPEASVDGTQLREVA